jgi:hypothetical protein
MERPEVIRSISGVALALAVAAGLLLASNLGRAGLVFEVLCNPGSFSETGFTPCTSCTPGTFSAGLGATHCTACPVNAFTSDSGRSFCVPCDCDDGTVCTLDTCNAVNGACSAEPPAAGCKPVTFVFDGTVTSVGESSLFTVGTPFRGHYTFDPLASDGDSQDPLRGTFISAIVDIAVRVGTGEDVVEATADSGRLFTFDNSLPGNADGYRLVIEPLSSGPPIPAGATVGFELFMSSSDQGTVTSDAIPTDPPDPATFPGFYTLLTTSGLLSTHARSDDFTLRLPEPSAEAMALVAALVVLARRWSGRPARR